MPHSNPAQKMLENPYETPQACTSEPQAARECVPVNWKAIARRWELMRIPYNLLVGLAGLLPLTLVVGQDPVGSIIGAMVYGLCANVMYLLGPITEMYMNWFADVWERRTMPNRVVRFIRTHYVTALLFIGGLLFSVVLTLGGGMVFVMTAGFGVGPN